jgi:hypothetical protein
VTPSSSGSTVPSSGVLNASCDAITSGPREYSLVSWVRAARAGGHVGGRLNVGGIIDTAELVFDLGAGVSLP